MDTQEHDALTVAERAAERRPLVGREGRRERPPAASAQAVDTNPAAGGAGDTALGAAEQLHSLIAVDQERLAGSPERLPAWALASGDEHLAGPGTGTPGDDGDQQPATGDRHLRAVEVDLSAVRKRRQRDPRRPNRRAVRVRGAGSRGIVTAAAGQQGGAAGARYGERQRKPVGHRRYQPAKELKRSFAVPPSFIVLFDRSLSVTQVPIGP
ncbi:hypothetical protein [Patulibacter defluvii]|uniref:hypothetical protein n=1 Tax=Patulibacter defluvii TaxID=3095358 RepID=UPI002A751199|nr:hypothetical protein [Patulibacter sp. DM4]